MSFRIPGIILCITFGVLFNNNVSGQERIGDWELRVQSEGGVTKDRVASTSAQANSGSKSTPKLVIRQTSPNKPVKLLIADTHNKEKDQCDYKDWKIMIDRTSIPVLGYTFEPAKTELKADWGAPADDLWKLFRKGLKLTVQVEQKCDSFSGESNLASYSFSLRGSYAAYNFVVADVK